MHFTAVLLALGPLITQTRAIQTQGQALFPARCFPEPCKGITFTDETFVCGDSRLGPVRYPANFPLNTELSTYARFGSLCPAEFLQKWTNATTGHYVFPQDTLGFLADDDNQIIASNVTLPVGMKVDRFGSESGMYMSPLGAPYIQRAIAPSSLKTYDGKYPFNYYVYNVTKAFVVRAGPIRPWFEQPGMGTQFLTYDMVGTLVQGGYLNRLSPEDYDEPEEYADDYTPGPTPTPGPAH